MQNSILAYNITPQNNLTISNNFNSNSINTHNMSTQNNNNFDDIDNFLR